MTYRIEHFFEDDMLRVALSGSVTEDKLDDLARDVIRLTQDRAIDRLFVDVRQLAESIGPVETLRLIEGYPRDSRKRRVAVLETSAQAAGHRFHETAALNRGHRIRHFTDATEAAAWLWER